MNLINPFEELVLMTLLKSLAVVNLLKTLAIIILVFYLLRWLTRIFAPILMRRMVDNIQQKAQQQYKKQHTTRAREGETVIDKKPSSTNHSSNDVGEYVDFEEVD